MSASEKLKRITRKLSRKLLGLPPKEKKSTIDSDTRRLVREAAAKALHSDVPDTNFIKPTSSTVIKSDDGSGHINFHRRTPTVRLKSKTDKVEKIVYYSEDGRLLS